MEKPPWPGRQAATRELILVLSGSEAKAIRPAFPFCFDMYRLNGGSENRAAKGQG